MCESSVASVMPMSQNRYQKAAAAAHGFLKNILKWLSHLPAGKSSPLLDINPLLPYIKEINCSLLHAAKYFQQKSGTIEIEIQFLSEKYRHVCARD